MSACPIRFLYTGVSGDPMTCCYLVSIVIDCTEAFMCGGGGGGEMG